MTVSASERLKWVKALSPARRPGFTTDGRMSGTQHLANLLGFKRLPSLSTADISSSGWGWLPFLVLNAAFSLGRHFRGV